MPRAPDRAALLILGAGAMLALLAVPAQAQLQGTILDNGVAQLGFRDLGNLGWPGPLPATEACYPAVGPPPPLVSQCNYMVGLREDITDFEGLTDNCVCEGWGIAYTAPAPTAGWAQFGQPLQYGGVTLTSFASNPATATATSVVQVGDLQVTHDVRSEPSTTSLFKIKVTIENTGASTVSGIVYRRTMDWDAEPTPYSEYVLISGSPTTLVSPAVPELLCSSWDPWVSADPTAVALNSPTLLPPVGPGSACLGPAAFRGQGDRGASFDFQPRLVASGAPVLGVLLPGEATHFYIYYGASVDGTVSADLATVGAQLVSVARPSYPPILAPNVAGPLNDPALGTPLLTYGFGYKWECIPNVDPGCTVVTPPPPPPPPPPVPPVVLELVIPNDER
ncbi:MAG: hypothetical protein ABR562_03305 [Thermoplasmatota archaeon]